MNSLTLDLLPFFTLLSSIIFDHNLLRLFSDSTLSNSSSLLPESSTSASACGNSSSWEETTDAVSCYPLIEQSENPFLLVYF